MPCSPKPAYEVLSLSSFVKTTRRSEAVTVMVSSGPLTSHSGNRSCHSQVSLILLACRADKGLKSSKEILVIFVWQWWGLGGAVCPEAMGVLPRLVETAGGRQDAPPAEGNCG